MKVVFFHYSLTGNTEYVAKQIAAALEKHGHVCKYINAVPIIRKMNLIIRDRAASKVPEPTGKEKEYLEYVEAVSDADIFAVGSLVSCGIPAPGLCELLSEQWLPDAALAKLKFILTYSTHGSVEHIAGDVLATILMGRKHSAVYAGHINLRVPENWVPLLPKKPYVDMWDPATTAKMREQAAALAEFVSKDYEKPPESVPFKTTPLNTDTYLDTFKYGKPVYVDKEKCIKCGLCFRQCPYHAITMNPDIEDGYPVFHTEWCYLCCNCFNQCPKEAVQMSFERSVELQRHRRTTATETEESLAKKGMVGKVIPDLEGLFTRLQ